MWKVVGGGDKGGIVVRQGQDLKSAAYVDRLSTGALLQELKLVGERLQYKLAEGDGPPMGWVSLKLKGNPLVVFDCAAICFGVNLEELEKRANSDNEEYQGDKNRPEWTVQVPGQEDVVFTPPPTRGKFVPEPTGRPQAGKYWTPKLQEVPKRLRAVTPFDEHLRAKKATVFAANMDALGTEGPIGYWYGLRFPYTFEMINRYGIDFLNDALHKAKTLPKDNSITKMEVQPFVGGSMSLKCFIHVEYAKPDEDLHSDLFVKYPFPATDQHERKSVYIQRFIMNNDGPEMDFARILSAGAPCKCPKYYFGDICMETGLALLITEKLPLPKHGEDIGPYELEAIPYKSVDYVIDKPFHYYDQMTRNIAKLAGWGKSGKLGKDIESVFPPPAQPAAYFMNTRQRIDDIFLPYCYIWAQCLIPEEILGPKGVINDEEWFVSTMREVMPEIERAQPEILEYLFADPDYGGFTHQNMNTDNAMFWRDEHNNVCSGFIDWGRFKRDNFARGLSNGYMCSDLCELVQQSDAIWIQNFIDVLAEYGGPQLKFEVFWEHYMLSWLIQGLAAVDLPRQLTLSGLPWMYQDGWKQIPSYKDPRVFRLPGYSNGMCAIWRNFAYYWKCRDLPGFWKRWKRAHQDILPKALQTKS